MERIDLKGLRPGQRFDAWRTVTEPFFDVSRDEGRATDFFFRMGATHWGEKLLVVETEVSGHRYDRTDHHARVGGFDQIAFQLYRTGCFTGRYGDADVVVEAGDINVVDFSKSYAKKSCDQSDIDLIIPRELVGAHFPGARHGAVLHSRSGLGRLAATHLHAFLESAAELSETEATSASISFLILLAQGNMRAAADETIGFARSSVRRMAEVFMRREMARPDLSVEAIAHHCGVSRATLFRAFEDEGGVRTRLLQLRLETARALLSENPGLRTQDACDLCGLADPTSFARQFRRAFGMTPSEARQAERIGGPNPGPAPERWFEAVRRLQAPFEGVTP